jgi:dTDP-4-dehydrorhamnose 3,5-epimerase
MPLNFIGTSISGLTTIIAHYYNDGSFSLKKYFQKDSYKDTGLPVNLSEANIITYKKGVLRGLHYQNAPSQGKLVFAATGSAFIAAVDLREMSKTFGRHECFSLSAEQNKAVYIPELFAFGVLSLEENTMLCYNCTGEYLPENCDGIIWNDRELNIPWPIDKLDSSPVLSEKDKKLRSFYDYRGFSKTSVFGENSIK